MKLKKILAAVAATAVAVSTMAVNAIAIDKGDYFADGTLYLVADDGKPQWAVDNNVDITTIYGVTMHCTFDKGEIADESKWIGGGIGANSPSTGWKSIEWGRNEKEIIADLENGTVTWKSADPIFKADDKYAHLWIQVWGGTVAFDSVDILDKDGNVIEAAPAPAADETASDDTAAADDKAAEETKEEDKTSAEADDTDVAADDADDEGDADIVDADDDADVEADEDDDAADDTAEDNAAPAVTEDTSAPAADTTTAAAATGNVAVASIVAVMAVAGAAAIVAKKRK